MFPVGSLEGVEELEEAVALLAKLVGTAVGRSRQMDDTVVEGQAEHHTISITSIYDL